LKHLIKKKIVGFFFNIEKKIKRGYDYLALDDQHENCLIEIMVCCVREAATGEYPIGRGQPNRKVYFKKNFSLI
jgi:hypothetical protein